MPYVCPYCGYSDSVPVSGHHCHGVRDAKKSPEERKEYDDFQRKIRNQGGIYPKDE